jgi:glycosyltransferase involved in cell wall biosynthesis
MTARAARTATQILADTYAAAEQITSIFDCSSRNITVAPLGVEPRFFDSAEPGARTYFLFVGNDMPHKNVGTLIDAFRALRRDNPSARLKLTGGAFSRFASEEGVEPTGFVPDADLPALYAGAIALVFPSMEEGFGLPALEAMACGTPVITSTAAALVEITGSAALHCDTMDAASYLDAMTRVWNDGTLAADLREAGKTRVAEFTWRRCAEITRSVYHRALL